MGMHRPERSEGHALIKKNPIKSWFRHARCLKAPPNLGGVGEVISLIRGSDKKTQPYRLGGEGMAAESV